VENRVGQNVPSEEKIQQLIDALVNVHELLAEFSTDLKDEERRRLVRWRPGGEEMLNLMAALARKYKLALPGVEVAGMEADLLLSKRVARLEMTADTLSRRIEDTRLCALSEGWWAATAIYTALCRTAESNVTLAQELKPAIEFFALGRRKSSQPEPSPT